MAPTAGVSQGALIRLDGMPFPTALYDQLIDVRVERSVSVASRFSLRFFDPDFKLLDSGRFAVGTAIDISFLDVRAQPVPAFAGEIVSLGIEQVGSERHELIVSGYDKAYRLSNESRIRSFQQVTYGDVISKIASENGLRADVAAATPAPRFEYLLQTTTDFAFVSEIAMRTGSEWNVDGNTLVFRTRPEGAAAATLTFGEDLRQFRARFSAADRTDKVTVRAWNPQQRQASVGVKAVVDATPSDGPPLLNGQRKKAKPLGGAMATGSPVALSRDEATVMAGALGERMARAEFSARGEAIGRPDLKAGSRVTLKGLGTQMSGTYYLTSVEHVLGDGRPLLTRFTVGGQEPASLVDLLGRGDAGPPAWGSLGVTVGIVTNNNNSQYPGQVRVKFPALSDQVESAWARIVSLGAGAQRGLMFMPEINDEVLVAFEHGDLRRPFVLGGLWEAQAALPVATYVEGNKVITGVIKTRTGHTMAFKDGVSPADRHFSVVLADGKTKVFVGEEKVEVWAADGKPLQLKSGQATVTLKNQGDIELKGMNITIDAQQALKLSGMSVDVTASTNLKAQASATLELKGTGPSKLESASLLEVKGTLLKLN